MFKLAILAALIAVVFKMIAGRWPWQPKISTRNQALLRARRLLGVEARAGRDDIIAAHRKLVTMVHPDKGGTNEQMHEANAARDILFDELPGGADNNQELK